MNLNTRTSAKLILELARCIFIFLQGIPDGAAAGTGAWAWAGGGGRPATAIDGERSGGETRAWTRGGGGEGTASDGEGAGGGLGDGGAAAVDPIRSSVEVMSRHTLTPSTAASEVRWDAPPSSPSPSGETLLLRVLRFCGDLVDDASVSLQPVRLETVSPTA